MTKRNSDLESCTLDLLNRQLWRTRNGHPAHTCDLLFCLFSAAESENWTTTTSANIKPQEIHADYPSSTSMIFHDLPVRIVWIWSDLRDPFSEACGHQQRQVWDCLASFTAASTASEPVVTKRKLSRPLGITFLSCPKSPATQPGQAFFNAGDCMSLMTCPCCADKHHGRCFSRSL